MWIALLCSPKTSDSAVIKTDVITLVKRTIPKPPGKQSQPTVHMTPLRSTWLTGSTLTEHQMVFPTLRRNAEHSTPVVWIYRFTLNFILQVHSWSSVSIQYYIQNAYDLSEPRLTNLTVEVNHSKIDNKREQKLQTTKPTFYSRASELTSRCQFGRSWFSSLSELCMCRFLEVGGVCLIWVQKISLSKRSCNYCVVPTPMLSLQRKGPNYSFTSTSSNQQAAGKC